jgi:hypothetical protein
VDLDVHLVGRPRRVVQTAQSGPGDLNGHDGGLGGLGAQVGQTLNNAHVSPKHNEYSGMTYILADVESS